jgi:hypothetical protein
MRMLIDSDNPEYWRRRAYETRSRAEGMVDLRAQEEVRHMADTYDKISVWISEREERHAEIRAARMRG